MHYHFVDLVTIEIIYFSTKVLTGVECTYAFKFHCLLGYFNQKSEPEYNFLAQQIESDEDILYYHFI